MVETRDGARAENPTYWRRTDSLESDGIIVVTAWIFSKQRQLERFSRLYASCNWDSLVTHPKVYNLWFPALAKTLAVQILDELSQELEKRPRPVVFATFSGGYMACLWKIYEILHGTCEGVDCTLVKYKTVRNWFAGQIHDSSPAEFESEVGARFISSPSVLKTKRKIPIVTTAARAGGNILDFFLLKRFQAQNLQLWSALYKSGDWGPILVLCSRDDDLTPFDRIQEFCSTMTGFGCNVTLVAWDESPHVGHFKRHKDEYKNAVRTFLHDVNTFYAHKRGLRPDNFSAGHLELNQTSCRMTDCKTLPDGCYEESNPSSIPKPPSRSIACAVSRL